MFSYNPIGQQNDLVFFPINKSKWPHLEAVYYTNISKVCLETTYRDIPSIVPKSILKWLEPPLRIISHLWFKLNWKKRIKWHDHCIKLQTVHLPTISIFALIFRKVSHIIKKFSLVTCLDHPLLPTNTHTLFHTPTKRERYKSCWIKFCF